MQISGLNPKTDFYEIRDSGKSIITSNYVVGTGQATCNELVQVFTPFDVSVLEEYNQTHKDYAIIYAGHLISRGGIKVLNYHQISNARVLIELGGFNHADPPSEHFGGLLRTTDKILMVSNHIDWDLLERVKIKGTPNESLTIYPVNVKITSSERQQKAVVELA